jgi:sugar phosphate isomerase/epimerase
MRTALSTSFLGLRVVGDLSWEKILESYRSIGATDVELSYNLVPDVAQEVLEGLPESGLRVVSAHHPLPFPDVGASEDPYADVFNPISPLESERRAACELIKDSLGAAARAGASALVVHLGSIQELAQDQREHWNRFKAGEDLSDFVSRFLKKREKRSKPYLERALRTLETLLPFAKELGVSIGLENRYFLISFPDLEEFRRIFEAFDTPYLGYWHDVGHGVARAHFGYEDPDEVAAALRGRLIGMHVHDAVGPRDHRPPGSGEVDFFKVFEDFGVPERVVFEPAPNMEPDKVKKGLEHMEGILSQLQ